VTSLTKHSTRKCRRSSTAFLFSSLAETH
jgi:hypothetical protein